MEFGNLIEAVETYLRVKGEAESGCSTGPCLEWDCDLAIDLEDRASTGVNAGLARRKRNLEEAVNRYIDVRVRRVLRNMFEIRHA